MKFAPLPKHPFDIGAIRTLVAKVNALLNMKVIDTTGAPAGSVKYADGNTTLIVSPAAAVDCLKYDVTKPSLAGTFYKVRATDTAVTDGVTVGGDTIKATPGKYLCLQAVPATPSTSAHIPQLPDGSGSTDPESTAKFWEYFCPADICVDGSTVNV